MNERYFIISLERSTNFISFWKVGDFGYTMEYHLAKRFTKEEVKEKDIEIIETDIIKGVNAAFERFFDTKGMINKIAIPVDKLKDLATGTVCYAFRYGDE